MTSQSNAPVIIGAGVSQQRFDDPTQSVEAGALMRQALENAADDADSRRALEIADALLLPRGTWPYANPVSVVAPWNPAIRSIVADIGVLQQTLLSKACAMVADGSSRVALVAGGEAKHRALRSQITGITALDTPTSGEPDQRLVPSNEILTQEEISRGLPVPARQYAMIDTALRSAQGLSAAEHINLLAHLWSDFSAVAADNTDAWTRAQIDRATLVNPTAANPMLAWPYTKLYCSQWNVDQAAGLIICSAATADELGIARDRWVFAHAGIESNLMVPLTRRAQMHRSPAVGVVGQAIQEHCGVTPADIEHLDIYSCFPAAVRVQQHELGIDNSRQLTVTGGMTFAGGPLNNYTLQATAKMVQVLRTHPSTRGLVTNVSGMLTKYGAAVWSCSPPEQPFAALDVTAAATAATPTVEVDSDYAGQANVITYTVVFDKSQPAQGIVVAETADGRRVIASSSDAAIAADMATNDWIDRSVRIDGAELLS
jgi:acetyl-CoA C-acetyltransferase